MGRTFPEVVVDWGIDLPGCEAVNDGIDSLNVGQAAREFAEFPLCRVDVEELASVRTIFDLRDLTLSAGKLDVVSNLKLSHH